MMNSAQGPTLFTLYGMFLRQYLDRCGPHREELAKQEEHIQRLRKLVETVKTTPVERRLEVLQNECKELGSTFPPDGLMLPTGSGKKKHDVFWYSKQGNFALEARNCVLKPRNVVLKMMNFAADTMRVTGLLHQKCKYMDSAQKPLWMVYENADSTGEPIIAIFKDGDDVRQDILVLQQFRMLFVSEMMNFVSEMMNFVSEMMKFVSEMMNFVSEMMNFVSEMMNFVST